MANNGWKKYYLCKIINRVNKSMVIFSLIKYERDYYGTI